MGILQSALGSVLGRTGGNPQQQAEPAEAVATDWTDRRAWTRFASEKQAVCGPVGQGQRPQCRTEIQDVSAGGVGLLVERYFHRGTVLVLHLREPGRTEPEAMFVRVTRAESRGDGTWFVGCAFGKPLADDALQGLKADDVSAVADGVR
jgi:hypothetical protein